MAKGKKFVVQEIDAFQSYSGRTVRVYSVESNVDDDRGTVWCDSETGTACVTCPTERVGMLRSCRHCAAVRRYLVQHDPNFVPTFFPMAQKYSLKPLTVGEVAKRLGDLNSRWPAGLMLSVSDEGLELLDANTGKRIDAFHQIWCDGG